VHACTLHGILGVDNGHAYQYAEMKRVWLHDGFIPIPNGNLPAHILTFGGHPVLLDEGCIAHVHERHHETHLATPAYGTNLVHVVLSLFGMEKMMMSLAPDLMSPCTLEGLGASRMDPVKVDLLDPLKGAKKG
jgi:hypothetical protein